MSDFPRTVWSVIRGAGSGRVTAVGRFVAAYRPAVVRFLRRRGVEAALAEDLAQEVFLRVFEDRVLEKADAARGRFRSLLLAVTRHVLSHHLERAHALKRGGAHRIAPLDDAALEQAFARDDEDPDFDREWLGALIAQALERLRLENESYHACIAAFLVEERSHAEIAARLGKTEGSVRNAVSRGRARLGAIVRELIAGTTSSEGELTDEVRRFARLLAKSPGTL